MSGYQDLLRRQREIAARAIAAGDVALDASGVGGLDLAAIGDLAEIAEAAAGLLRAGEDFDECFCSDPGCPCSGDKVGTP